MIDSNAIAPALGRALAARGFEALTPVQEAMLSPDHDGQDLLVSAQTGSGKTVAFGIAMSSSILEAGVTVAPSNNPLALIVAPTRELAVQVSRELEWLYGDAGARVVSCVGGMDPRDERRALARGAHIVVGTPGRLVDHINRGGLILNDLRVVVMDEADEMLDMGFRDELETILKAAPDDRRTLLFSATVSKQIARLAANFQRDAIRVNTISGEGSHGDIEYRAHAVAPSDAENAIMNVLRFHEAKNALVFCKTRANVNHLLARFHNRGMNVVAMSGELSQKERTHALQALRDGRANVCVATDVAARGLDLPDLDLVVHADLPSDQESLLHRSGRTGRAGRKGISVLIVPFKARRRIERLLGDAKVEAVWSDAPGADEIRARDDERLLNHPSLSETPSAADAEMAKALIDVHGAEQIAAAFVALHRARQSAPEELMPVPEERPSRDFGDRPKRDFGDRPKRERREPRPRSDERAPRDDFDNGQWVILSVGRKSGAEPRWLLPMLCKAGGLDRTAVGAIRIEENITKVELKSEAVESFFAVIGPEGRLEKSITAWRDGDVPPFRKNKPAAERSVHDESGPVPFKKPKKQSSGARIQPKARLTPPSELPEIPVDKPAKRPSKHAGPKRDKPKFAKAGKPAKPGKRFSASANKPPKRRKPNTG